MIQYLKDSERVIKVDTDLQKLTVCLVKGNQMLLRHDNGNTVLYNNVVSGSFEPATEEEFLIKKNEILSAI